MKSIVYILHYKYTMILYEWIELGNKQTNKQTTQINQQIPVAGCISYKIIEICEICEIVGTGYLSLKVK